MLCSTCHTPRSTMAPMKTGEHLRWDTLFSFIWIWLGNKKSAAIHRRSPPCPRTRNGRTSAAVPCKLLRKTQPLVLWRLLLLENNMTFSAWLRVSLKRSEAVGRQEKKRKRDGQYEQRSFREMQWLSGLSPACCPTYGPSSSKIRIRIQACVQSPPLLLLNMPSDFICLPDVQTDCKLLSRLNRHDRDGRIHFVSESHVYYVDDVPMRELLSVDWFTSLSKSSMPTLPLRTCKGVEDGHDLSIPLLAKMALSSR